MTKREAEVTQLADGWSPALSVLKKPGELQRQRCQGLIPEGLTQKRWVWGPWSVLEKVSPDDSSSSHSWISSAWIKIQVQPSLLSFGHRFMRMDDAGLPCSGCSCLRAEFFSPSDGHTPITWHSILVSQEMQAAGAHFTNEIPRMDIHLSGFRGY